MLRMMSYAEFFFTNITLRKLGEKLDFLKTFKKQKQNLQKSDRKTERSKTVRQIKERNKDQRKKGKKRKEERTKQRNER